jgi:hypothetical protein
MNPELSITLIALLLALTLLGAVIGYCTASILIRRQAKKVIAWERECLSQEALILQSHLQSPEDQNAITEKRTDNIDTSEQAVHGTFAKIRKLEARLEEFRKQKNKQEAHDTSYSDQERKVLPAAPGATVNDDDTHRLPILMRRVDGVKSTNALPLPAPENQGQNLSRELEIPPLAESELADADEDLELDVSVLDDDGGVNSRG